MGPLKAGQVTSGTAFSAFWPHDGRKTGEDAMVYVQRDADGLLLRVECEPFEGMTDTLAVESEELESWLRTREEVQSRLASLKKTDLDLIRVLEDVVIVLVERGVISFTDLPEAARHKLDERALARAELEGLNSEIQQRLKRSSGRG